MRHSFSLLLLPVAAALSACGDNGTAPKGFKIFDCANGNRYQIGQTVSGSIGTGDCTDPSGTGRADYYQFTLTNAGPVAVTLTNTSQGSPRLINAILTPDGNTTHFRLTNLGGSTTVGGNFAAGTYVIVVGASEDAQSSSYALSSSATLPAPFDCLAIGALTFGTTINGSFAASDCADPEGYAPTDYYSFTLAAPSSVTLSLTAPVGQAAVAIGDDTGEIWDFALTAPGDPAVITVDLPAGRFYAIVAATQETQTSSYTLESSRALTASMERSGTASPRRSAPRSAHRRW